MDYNNPFAGFQESAQGPQRNAIDYAMERSKYEEGLPFIAMAKQRQQLELQDLMRKSSEESSPEAVQSRLSGLQAKTAQNQGIVNEQPSLTESNIALNQHKAKIQPYLTSKDIAEAEMHTTEAKGYAGREETKHLGNLGAALASTPEPLRQKVLDQYNSQWEKEHPGHTISESFKQYSPDLMTAVAKARYTQLHSIEQENKKELEKMKNDSAQAVAQTQAGAHIKGTEIAASATRYGVDQNIAAGKGQSAAQILHNLSQIITDQSGKYTSEQKQAAQQEYQMTKTKEIEDLVSKSPTGRAAFLAKLNAKTPEEHAAVESDLQRERDRVATSMGLVSKTMDKGKINIGGVEYEKLEELPDGRIRIRDPKTGRTGVTRK